MKLAADKSALRLKIGTAEDKNSGSQKYEQILLLPCGLSESNNNRDRSVHTSTTVDR